MCGIVGLVSKNKEKNIIPDTINCLKKLQHRGQDSAGICFIEENNFKLIKNNGLVNDVLKGIQNFSNYAIAHTRYKTAGNDSAKCAQPFLFNDIALVHNGHVETFKQKKILKDMGFNFETDSDSEVILKWLCYKVQNWTLEEISNALEQSFGDGAYNIILLFKDKIMAFKDKNSYHPLTFFETKDAYYLSSEDINFSSINRLELGANCAIEITLKGYRTFLKETKTKSQCVFEAVYFACVKNKVFNIDVKNTRLKLGEILASGDNFKADYVVPVMNSGFFGAVGYSKKRNIPLKILIKNKANLRTFIEKKDTRNILVKEKYSISPCVRGKDIILIDDSIVRGTTSRHLINLLKNFGVNKIHLRLTSPMIINTCRFGVDIPDKNELLAYNYSTVDNIKEELGVDSIKFISNSDFKRVFNPKKWCHKCFTAINNQE